MSYIPPKKIFFLLPNLNGGGAERVVLCLAAALQQQALHDEVTLVTFSTEGAYQEHVPAHIRLVDLSAPRARYSFYALWRLCRKEKPDVVVSTMQASTVFGLVRRFIGYTPYWICRMENPITQDRVTMGRMSRWLFERALAAAHTVVCLNDAMRDDVVVSASVQWQHTVVIPNPIDIETVRQHAQIPVTLPHAGRTIVMCGRLVTQKNYPLALVFIRSLQCTDVHLYILGEGELQADLKALAAEYGITSQVHFVGFQDNPYAWMAAADLFLLSSHYEGFGNVLVEALAAGVPVVSTDCPTGPTTILSALPYTALVEIGNVEQLTTAVSTVFQWSETTRVAAITAGQVVAERYRPSQIASQYISIYTQS